MKRASTPTHHFKLPVASDEIKTLVLTYAQKDGIVLQKHKEDLTLSEDGWWSITLTQEETNLFKSGSARGEIRYLTTNGKAPASKIFYVDVEDVLDDTVLT